MTPLELAARLEALAAEMPDKGTDIIAACSADRDTLLAAAVALRERDRDGNVPTGDLVQAYDGAYSHAVHVDDPRPHESQRWTAHKAGLRAVRDLCTSRRASTEKR